MPMVGLLCNHRAQGRPVGVYHRMGDEIPHGGRTASNLEEGQKAMGINWMPWDSLKEAVPPAYTEYIGRQAKKMHACSDGSGSGRSWCGSQES